MQARIKELRSRVDKAMSKKEYVESMLELNTKRRDDAVQKAEDAESAKALVLEVATRTQANIGNRVSELVSLALASVFEDPYSFEVEFVQRRGVTEADLWFCRQGHKIEPMFNSGGGAIDVASLALRMAVWSLKRTAPVFVLDEPFRFLHGSGINAKAAAMLQELSHKFGIQVIRTAAIEDEDAITGADRVFRVTEAGVIQEG